MFGLALGTETEPRAAAMLKFGKLGKQAVDWSIAGATTAIVVPGALKTAAVVALKGIGFTSVGPAAGSYAAAWMSSLAASGGGGVASGSLYAGLQSAAMTIPLVTPAAAVVGTGAAMYYAAPRVYKMVRPVK